MEISKLTYSSVIIVVLTVGVFLKDRLLTADKNDLLLNSATIHAARLHLPSPGKAYVYYVNVGAFEKDSLCGPEEISEAKVADTITGVNSLGVGFNNAIEFSSGFLSAKIVSWLRIDQPSKSWVLDARFNIASEWIFEENCWTKIEEKLEHRDARIYIVETVFFVQGDQLGPFMVEFKPQPLVPDGCKPNCNVSATLDQLLSPSWSTTLKSMYMDFY
ncbi:MAG: hypothetical protein COB16_05280 [Rhodobacteraceae bacterium]|nr:MAG: hypothetical protein COB16_05280 [Paracoccaceae bacterium]